MDGMTINHIVSIDHGSRVNNVQVEWRDRRSTSVTPSHHQKPPYCHIAGIFLWYSTKLQDATRNPGKIGVYELDSRYISINLGKLPLESENAWLCSPPTHSSRGKSLVAMDFQGCLLRAESVLLLRRPGELGLSNHPAPGRGVRLASKCLLCKTPVWPKRRASGGLQNEIPVTSTLWWFSLQQRGSPC